MRGWNIEACNWFSLQYLGVCKPHSDFIEKAFEKMLHSSIGRAPNRNAPVGRPLETLQSPPPPRAKILQSNPPPPQAEKNLIISSA